MVEGPIRPWMTTFPLEVWMAIGAVTVLGLLAVLYTLAETVRCETYTHDVKVKAQRLRLAYAAQIRSEREREIIVVDEAPAEEDDPFPMPAGEPLKQAA
jgi:hypothetical protein